MIIIIVSFRFSQALSYISCFDKNMVHTLYIIRLQLVFLYSDFFPLSSYKRNILEMKNTIYSINEIFNCTYLYMRQDYKYKMILLYIGQTAQGCPYYLPSQADVI